jgi:hypothetical protein
MGYSLCKFNENEMHSIQKKIITILAGDKKVANNQCTHFNIYFLASEFIRSLLPFGLEN